MPNPELERLERLDHPQRIRHWNSAKPWGGVRLPAIQKPFLAHRVKVDRGSITAMPLLVGRPCFGQPTAIMRHGGGTRQWSPKTRSWVADRCLRCAVNEACKYVVAERLRATPKIDDQYREWVRLGGREATWRTDGPPGTVSLVYADLIRLLTTEIEFTSVNDALVAAHYDGLEEKRRAEDAKRKRKDRARKSEERARQGKFDEDVLQALSGQMAWRFAAHRGAQKHPKGPSQIKMAKTASMFDAQTWLAKTRLELRGIFANDSNVARELQAIGIEQHRSHGGLRDSVRRALSRIDLLERTRLPGRSSVIWPRFGMLELRDQLASDPLQSLG